MYTLPPVSFWAACHGVQLLSEYLSTEKMLGLPIVARSLALLSPLKVRYTTPEGKQFDGLTGGIGGGGLFIESGAPLNPGTELTIEFALPDLPGDRLKAKAKVAWVRNKPERYLCFQAWAFSSWT